MKHISITSFNGNPNVGLFGIVTDKHILLGKEVGKEYDEELEKVMDLPVKRVSIMGTSLIGVFCVAKGNKLLVPHIIFDDEKKLLEDLGYELAIIKSELTCLGNNIMFSDAMALINPDYSDAAAQQIADALGLEVEKSTIMEIEALGAIGLIRDGLGLFHRDIGPKEVKDLEKKLAISITQGTINMGNAYIKSGILLGKNGFVVGNASGGPEIKNADEALGFI